MGKDLSGKELGVGLSQRKDGRYSARYVNKYGKRIELYDAKLANLKKRIAEVKYEEEHGLLGDPKKITVDTWFDNWVKTYKQDVVSDSTLKNYLNSYKYHIKPSIGNLLINKVKPIQLQQILNDMYDDDYEFGTMNLAKITLRALFEGAVQNEYIIKNPAQHIKCKQRDVADTRVLTIAEQEEFLKYAKQSMYYCAYRFALQTGLRVGELGGIRWQDFDSKKKTISVTRTLLFDKSKGGFYFGKPKTQTSIRTIPLTDEAVQALNEQRINQFKLRAKSNNWNTNDEFNDLIFTSINGKPTGSATYRNNMIRIVTNINHDRRAMASMNKTDFEEFQPLSFHCLRRTMATRCMESNIKPKILQSILGHSSITTTMDIYVKSTQDEQRNEISKLKPVGVEMA